MMLKRIEALHWAYARGFITLRELEDELAYIFIRRLLAHLND